MNYLAAIDPGSKGAIAFCAEKGDIAAVFDRKDVQDIVQFLSNNIVIHAYCEECHSMPHDSKKATLSFGRQIGFCEGLFAAFSIPITFIPPKEWQNYLLKFAEEQGISFAIPKDKDERKKAIAVFVKNIVGYADLYGPRGGLKDGRSDAVALLQYAIYIHSTGKKPLLTKKKKKRK